MNRDESLEEFLRVYADVRRRHGVKTLPFASWTALVAILLAAEECYGSEIGVATEPARWLQ